MRPLILATAAVLALLAYLVVFAPPAQPANASMVKAERPIDGDLRGRLRPMPPGVAQAASRCDTCLTLKKPAERPAAASQWALCRRLPAAVSRVNRRGSASDVGEWRACAPRAHWPMPEARRIHYG